MRLRLLDDLICLGIGSLHDLVFIYKLVCLSSCLCEHRIRFAVSIGKDRVLIADDLLILLDLIRDS